MRRDACRHPVVGAKTARVYEKRRNRDDGVRWSQEGIRCLECALCKILFT